MAARKQEEEEGEEPARTGHPLICASGLKLTSSRCHATFRGRRAYGECMTFLDLNLLRLKRDPSFVSSCAALSPAS
jgi:hypothetical protein